MVVHHGGAGMTSECALFGVPSVIVPLAFDQFKNANRAKKLGIASIAAPATTDIMILNAWNNPVEKLYDEFFARKFTHDVIETIDRIIQE
jgi:UDP:flavonoid glycosyltransferase YjiC (YdhE family)